MPSWIDRLEELYASGAACQFIAHGNVQDVFWHAAAEGKPAGLVPPAAAPRAAGAAPRDPFSDYLDLDTFLVRRLLGGFSIIIEVDLAHGIEVHRGRERLEGWDGLRDLGELRDSPKAYLMALRRLFLFLNNRAVSERQGTHVAAILRDAQLLVPGEASNVYFDLGACATLVRDWSRPSPHEWFSLTTFLLAENLADLHPIVRTNPLAASLEVGLPSEAELLDDLQRLAPVFAETMGAFARCTRVAGAQAARTHPHCAHQPVSPSRPREAAA